MARPLKGSLKNWNMIFSISMNIPCSSTVWSFSKPSKKSWGQRDNNLTPHHPTSQTLKTPLPISAQGRFRQSVAFQNKSAFTDFGLEPFSVRVNL
jgi:hypothetical protein